MVEQYTTLEKRKVFWGYIGFYLGLQILFSLIFGVIYMQVMRQTPTNDDLIQLSAWITFVTALATFVWVLISTKRNLRIKLQELLQDKSMLKWIPIGFGAMYLINFLASSLYMWLGIDGTSENQVLLEGMVGNYPLLMILPVVLLIPVVEEILFRGVILEVVQSRFGLVAAVVVSNSIFTLMHVADATSLIFFPMYFGLGLMLTWLYLKTNKNIFISSGAHILNNLLSVLVMIFLT